MASNKNLGEARDAKQDEFYTRLIDIERELRHYSDHFAGKTVFCNCDDPFESNFFKYFVLNFNRLKIKKLITTCYAGSPIANRQLSFFDLLGTTNTESSQNKPYKAIVTTVYDKTGDGGVDLLDIAELFRSGENVLTELQGDGDFRSPECEELMDEADIVVTNPPFSLFREYVTELVKRDKSFIVLGPPNGIKYKETFPLIRDNKMWLGYKSISEDMYFHVPDDFKEWLLSNKKERSGFVIIDGEVMGRAQAIWFTNLDIKKRHEDMILYKQYKPEDYLSYTNFDGIDVPNVSDIPVDWNGQMGVPISFLGQHNPEQFEIIGLGEGNLAKEIGITRNKEGRTKLEVKDRDGIYKRPYARLVIRNKQLKSRKEQK